ncbi:MAG: hypothetical protein IJA15_06950 [Clostridia bacterium]|nr:hypothetical protein [Clostridia bacterium]
MKKIEITEQLKRASTVIKADRLGVSAGVESIISNEIRSVLEDFFSINGEVKTLIEIDERGFSIIIKALATSVKQLKILE